MLSLALLVGCDDASTKKQVAELAEKVKAADENQQKAVARIASLEKRVSDLTTTQFRHTLELNRLKEGSAQVSSEDHKYGIVHTEHGIFTVFAGEPRPFLDGYKVRLEIGNLTNARFTGAKIHVWWSRPYDEKEPDKDLEAKDKVFDVSNVFPPGAYTNVDVALTPAKAEAIKTLSVGLEFNSMSLIKAQ